MDLSPLLGSAPASQTPTSLTGLATPGERGQAAGKPWSPESPLFAFAVLLAVTTGLMAVGTSVRVGNARGSLQIGDTK
jgi:hypothetical protein